MFRASSDRPPEAACLRPRRFQRKRTRMDNPRVRRLCVVVDIRRYSELDTADQDRAQSALARLLDEAAATTGVPRFEWTRQDGGDGELALLPPGIDEVSFVESFVEGLGKALHAYHRIHALRLRLRVAMHQGLTQLSETGYSGGAVITVSRLAEARQIKDLLEEYPEADFVLVMSESLFCDVISDDSVHLNRGVFRQVRIEMPEKDFRADARAYVHGAPTATAVPSFPDGTHAGRDQSPHESPEREGGSVISTVDRSTVTGHVITSGGGTISIGGGSGGGI
jgi:hypothetical protein